MSLRPTEILLVEDNPGDINLLKEAFSDLSHTNHVSSVTDGSLAMKYLKKEGAFESAPSPDIVILDLNIPKKDGLSVLREIRADENLQHLPVIILSSSAAQSDIFESYKAFANAYICKPMKAKEFVEIGRAIGKFWFQVAKHPVTDPWELS